MYARCPSCRSIFEVTLGDLDIADGQMCCGVCDTVFNARDTLSENLPEDTTIVEKTIVDKSIRRKRRRPPSRVKALARDLTGKGELEPHNRRLLLACIGLFLLVVTQWLVATRGELATKDSGLIAIPKILGFNTDPQWDPDNFLTEQKMQLQFVENRASKTALDELHASLKIKNGAKHAQPLPHLLLSLNDRWGDAITQRLFKPEEIVAASSGDNIEPDTPTVIKVSAGEVIMIDISLVDPGQDVLGFSWDLCYPQKNQWRCQRDYS
ncbi:MAG: DUF3426 domain-containing protein [Gammaproteobacteria bacterium]|nr:DUF3426 domain-containing protein [Gammaproteobacteria bacterium]